MYSFKQNLWQGVLFFLKLIFVTLFIFSVYLGYQYWLASTIPLPPLQSFGLDGELPPDLFLAGALYFSAVVDEESTDSYIFKQSLPDLTYTQVLDTPSFSYSQGPGDDPYDVAVVKVAEAEGSPTWQPIWHEQAAGVYNIFQHMWGYMADDLVMSPDNTHYAYSYLSDPSYDSSRIYNHNVALHNYDTGELVTLVSANEPHFIRGGLDLIYMKEEGIYRYNLASGESYPFSMFYENLTIEEDYAMSSDDSTLVFTSPYLNLISVQRLNENFVTDELGIIVTPDTSYRYPVIDPTNRFYTVMASKAGEVQAEVRLTEYDDLIDRMSFDGFKAESVVLNQWLSF